MSCTITCVQATYMLVEYELFLPLIYRCTRQPRHNVHLLEGINGHAIQVVSLSSLNKVEMLLNRSEINDHYNKAVSKLSLLLNDTLLYRQDLSSNISAFAYRECTENGTWFVKARTGKTWANYSMCKVRGSHVVSIHPSKIKYHYTVAALLIGLLSV